MAILKGVVRLSDKCSGHKCYHPRPNIQASTNVFVNNRGVHRQSDKWQKHRCGPSSHASILAAGSQFIYVNNLQMARRKDPVKCGSKCLESSANVFGGKE